jgi:uncharacterized membrane protein HdeD (DUF308 family)
MNNDKLRKPTVESNLPLQSWQFFEGFLFVILGVLSMTAPQLFSIIDVEFLGCLMLVSGLSLAAKAVFLKRLPGRGFWQGISFLQCIVGILIITHPMVGVVTITGLLTLYFFGEGSIKLMLMFSDDRLRYNRSQLGFSAVTSLVFAAVIVWYWSSIEYGLLGLLLGVNMIILGTVLIKISLTTDKRS